MTTKIHLLALFLISFSILSAQDIVINEMLASSDSTSGISDFQAEYEDWIEIYNSSSSSVDISGWSLSDDLVLLDKWSFPSGTSIAANSYLVVWCDNDSTQEGFHAYFKLAKSGEIVTLSNSSGQIEDQVAFDQQSTNTSWARIPNGTGSFDFDTPSYNCSNDTEYGPLLTQSALVVNEILAASDSTGTITDPGGKVEDWVELFNKTSSPIDLYGYYLSDDPLNRFKWKIPFGTVLAADDYLIFWCDNDQEQEGIHTSFNLSASGESMILSYEDGSIIDITTWPIQTTNTSYARMPNGTGSFQVDLTPSFSENNGGDSAIEGYFDDRINTYPSPVRNQLNLSLSSSLITLDIRYQILDMSGKLWLEGRIESTESSVSIPSSVPSGLYFIQVDNSVERLINKIVIE